MRRIPLLLAVFIAALVPQAGSEKGTHLFSPDPFLPWFQEKKGEKRCVPFSDVAAARARLFQRNRDLIQTLVQGGLRLAAADDALQRAECCSSVAEHLATAIQQAALNQEKARVAELGLHLRALLETGVAANLSTARSQIPIGSTLEKNLREVRDRTAHLVEPLEDHLLRVVDAEDQEGIRHTLNALQVGRTEVEKALESPITITNGTSP